MSENKDKLIQLFKNCCDDNKFEKSIQKSNTTFNTPFLLVEESPFKIDEVFERMIKNCGISNFESRKRYRLDYDSNGNYFNTRSFEFSSKPPLVMMAANAEIKYKIKDDLFIIGPEETIESSDTYKEYEEKNILFFKYKKVKVVHHKIKTKFIEIKEDSYQKIIDVTEKMMDERCEIQFKNSPIKNLLMLDYPYTNNDINQILKNKKISTFRYVQEFSDENLIRLFQEYNYFKINGAILMMGEVWSWISLSEYKELEKYYTDSIKKSHLQSLDDRLNGKI